MFVSAAHASDGLSYGVEQSLLATPAWEQANSSGFGDPQTSEVTALAAFGDYLYAGTYHPTDPLQTIDGAQIFRSSDGITWTAVTDPGFGNSHDTAPPAILDLTVFNGYLYASTGRGNAAQIWRSSTGNEFSWARVINAGFGDPDIVDITVMAEYKSQIYVGVTKQDSEAQIWRSFTGDGTLSNWTQVVTGTEPASVSALTVYDGALYAAVEFESGAPVQIWRSYGGEWTTVVSDGFGDADTIFAGGMAEFGGYLYAGAGNSVDGAQLWRSNDGTSWTQVITPGFGDGNNQQVEAVFVFQNELYASTQNGVTGMELWRSADGATWEQANADGFGDANNSGSNWSNASAAYLGELYMGTVNAVDGGELWRMQQPYGVALSGDDALSGAPGADGDLHVDDHQQRQRGGQLRPDRGGPDLDLDALGCCAEPGGRRQHDLHGGRGHSARRSRPGERWGDDHGDVAG